jgi:L-threonylcarbamoyladenylate synthase
VSVRIVPAEQGIAEAAERLRAGQLVAFPTETVYGLGANALDPEAVARIFAAKGRPSTNPLIVHVPDAAGARELAAEWPEAAKKLAARFWPGPLTLVLPRTDAIPDIVTAGGPTVGLRVPSHPVALELFRTAGVPVAAPSANRSEEVSPTTAQHVADSLGPFVDDLLILDGGPTTVGLESTVLDVTTDPPRILRPGMVTAPMLREVLGDVAESGVTDSIARSPGQMLRHYAPKVPLLIVPSDQIKYVIRFGDGIVYYLDFSKIPQDWRATPFQRFGDRLDLIRLYMPNTADEYARLLYSALHSLESSGVKRILIQEPPHGPEWEAVHDRLRRAATPKSSEGRK